MFSSYVLYDTVAIEAVYFPHDFLHNTSAASTTAAAAAHADTSPASSTQDKETHALRLRDILLHRLTERYVGRIIPSRGLCVAITDVLEYSAAAVRGAVASAWLTATFGVCVFAPTPGTRLKARIAHQSAAGIFLTLDFFVAIPFLVPAALLVPGSRFHAPQCSWYLPLDGEGEEDGRLSTATDTMAASSQAATLTVPHNTYLEGAEVVVKVESCTVQSEEAVAVKEDGDGAGTNSALPSTVWPSHSAVAAVGGTGGEAGGPPAIMELRGSFMGDALGPMSWFEDA